MDTMTEWARRIGRVMFPALVLAVVASVAAQQPAELMIRNGLSVPFGEAGAARERRGVRPGREPLAAAPRN